MNHGPTARRALVGDGARALAAAGVESAWVESGLLLAHVLGVEWGRLLLHDDLPAEAPARFHTLLARRVAREPLQHITGTAPFRWLELAVGPGVFVPRPETELLVDLVAADVTAAARVVDLCAGSGALALAIAQEHRGAQVTAVEFSPAALAWLRRNAADRAAGGDPPVGVVDADVRGHRPAELAGAVDVVVSNPPYVPTGTPVSAEVHADPAEAVFAGPDGLGLLPDVAATAAFLLRPGGRFAAEHDESHAAAVRALVAAAGFDDVVTERDLAGRERFVTARRSAAEPTGQDATSWA